MRKLSTLTAAAALAAFTASLGFGDEAFALGNELTNGDAEAGDLSGWDTSNAPNVQNVESMTGGFGTLEEHGGSNFFTFRAPGGGQLGATESIDQDVDVLGCSTEYLAGTFTASGWIATQDRQAFLNDDFGTFTLEFFDAFDSQVGSTTSIDNMTGIGQGAATIEDWGEFSVSGPVPLGAETANYEVAGTEEASGGSAINVSYDDLFFETDCALDFAKISGGIRGQGSNGQGGGKGRPTHSFDGVVGNLESGVTGDIEINYKELRTVCTFTATSVSYGDAAGDDAHIEATYECSGGDLDGANGDAEIWLTDRGDQEPRGSISVDADDDDLDISDSSGNTGVEEALDRGNVILMPPAI